MATKFIFTITAGRTGTEFLTELFKVNYPEAETHHELLGYDRFGVDTPDLSDLTQFNSVGNTPKVQAFWKQKLARIATTPAPIYVETSHLLSKSGLVENIGALAERGEVHLILLTREIHKMVISYLSRGDFGDYGNMWMWYLDPRYPRNILNPSSFVKGGREELCLWYSFEMAVRQEYYRLLLKDSDRIHIHDADLSKITKEEGAIKFFEALKLETPDTVIIPPPQNVHAASLAWSPEKVEEFRSTIEGLDFDAASLARQFFDSGKRL